MGVRNELARNRGNHGAGQENVSRENASANRRVADLDNLTEPAGGQLPRGRQIAHSMASERGEDGADRRRQRQAEMRRGDLGRQLPFCPGRHLCLRVV